MNSRIRIAVALAAFAMPSALAAQEQAPPPEVQEILGELQQIQQQLESLQQQALQDTGVQRDQQRAVEAVRLAMVETDPTIEQKLTRLEELMQEAQQAQAAGDSEAIAALTVEAQQIQPAIETAQQAALANPAVESRIQEFQAKLRGKMAELDPDSKPLLDRLAQLEDRLEATVRDMDRS